MWTVRMSVQAHDFLQNVQEKNRRHLENGLTCLTKDPYLGKSLRGELKGYWSFRVGQYRMIYVIKKREIVVEILRIHHRKEVYEKMRRF